MEDREDATDAEDDGLLWNAAEDEAIVIVPVVTVPSALSGGVGFSWVQVGMKAASCTAQAPASSKAQVL